MFYSAAAYNAKYFSRRARIALKYLDFPAYSRLNTSRKSFLIALQEGRYKSIHGVLLPAMAMRPLPYQQPLKAFEQVYIHASRRIPV